MFGQAASTYVSELSLIYAVQYDASLQHIDYTIDSNLKYINQQSRINLQHYHWYAAREASWVEHTR